MLLKGIEMSAEVEKPWWLPYSNCLDEVVQKTKKARKLQAETSRKIHYDRVFASIFKEADKGFGEALLEPYLIENFGVREFLEKNGFKVKSRKRVQKTGLITTDYYVGWLKE